MLTVTAYIGKCRVILEFCASCEVCPSGPDPIAHAVSILSSGNFGASLTHSFNERCRSVPPDDDEYRSSWNIAISLFRWYKTAVERGGGENLKEFISAGVNAYALGCTSEGLRDELADLKESGVEIEAMQISGRNTNVKTKIFSEQIDECILWLGIIFITILCTPQPTVIRWSSVSPVPDELLVQWKGFCAIIANAYYIRGMAWLPVKKLQLEQMAIMGYAEDTSVVASRMRLVFSTLEVVSLHWPRV
ncbi:hypothetical protein MLD38_021457 [Melastoma candidum]|uniref:Uncharacterized protein n=1 Tax=Melastoma candidum TaxID=119954 RepID=A0ACB9QGD2_9MYRT|nr:hypothetical protein MLD38_021457 [Melastoma candidum]